MKKIQKIMFIFSCCFFITLQVVFSHGSKDTDMIEVEKLENWQETFDLNGKKAGKYNIYVSASDLGGNTKIEGPYNLYIDPKSDLPVCGITNPHEGMRILGNLNIVGTCVDDDAVEYVDLIFDGDEENPVRAKGKEFWSYTLDTTNLEEGLHTIKVVGTDINGLQGNPVVLNWNLDRRQPITEVTSHPMGQLVSGKVKFSGKVSDGNGIKSLSYSVDNGIYFKDVKLSSKGNEKSFSITIDTTKFEDGPTVLWFKAVDSAGSVGVYSFLYFIDNTKPEVEILVPEEKDVQYGKFAIAGIATDLLEMKSLSWTFGKDYGEIEIIPGNPYWGVMFNTIGSKDSSRVFTITGTDTAGNVVKVSKKILLNQELDKPTVEIQYPTSETLVGTDDKLFVRGIASDKEGVGLVKYKLDNGDWITEETKGTFCGELIDGSELSPGKHTITVVAVDKNGVEGNASSVSFSARGAIPSFSEARITGKNPRTVVPGMSVHPEEGAALQVTATSGLGFSSVTAELKWGKNGIQTFNFTPSGNSCNISIPFAADGPKGVVKVSITAVDTINRVKNYKTILNVVNTSVLKLYKDSEFYNDAVPVPENTSGTFATEDGSVSASIVSINGEAYTPGMNVRIPVGSSAVLVCNIESAAPVQSVNYSISGDSIPGGSNQTGSVKPVKGEENKYSVEIPLAGLPVRMNVIKINFTISKILYDDKLVGSFAIVRPYEREKTDDERAVYTMETNETFVDSSTGFYVMETGVPFYFYANTPELAEVNLIPATNGLSVEQKGNTVILTATADGTYRGVQVRVKDINGATFTSPSVGFIVDGGAPEVHFSSPANHSWVKKSVRITGTAVDPSGVKSGEFSVDNGATWNRLPLSANGPSATFSADIDLSKNEEGLVGVDVRVTDIAGHTGYAHLALHKDITPPTVTVLVPKDDAVVNGDNLIGFSFYDNGAIDRVTYVAPPGAKIESRRQNIDVDNFMFTHVGTKERPIDESMAFEFADAAGNVFTLEAWRFMIDNKSDLPISEIHMPQENEVITRDFTISGVVYDDDGPANVYYKIDNAAYKLVEEANDVELFTIDADGNQVSAGFDRKRTSFSIPIDFSTMTDNEHTIYIYSVDANGVQGPTTERKIRVSTEEPKGEVLTPTIDTSVKNVITITGTASDKNGIDKVQVSLDNGNSYNDSVGAESWSYTFDTRVIPNGTGVVFIKVFDKYGIEGLYSSLINIDNLPPEMILDFPIDYSSTAGPLFFSGYAFDNVEITEMYATIRSLEGKSVPSNMRKIPFELERIISRTLDISSLDNGNYNIELTALDKSGNEKHIGRNVTLNKNKPLAEVNLLYPLNGEHKQGVFNIYGEVTFDKPVETITLYIDEKMIGETELLSTGYFKFNVTPEVITAGVHKYRVDVRVEGGSVIKSRVQTIEYSNVGPWITIDNFNYGDFAIDRPYISGHAGYSLDEEELLLSKMKKASPELKETVAKKKVEKVEVSFDNGKTFSTVAKAEKWMYRVENFDLPEGFHFMLVRATMRNGEVAIDRAIIQIDNTAPNIRLIAPSAGGRYNQELLFSGLSSDEVGLKNVTLALRKGDKASYEVPSFIQGLYVDWSFWGATLFSIGAGLTFFDDNVKLQFQWGQFTKAQYNIFMPDADYRYGGDNILGIKILANVFQLPFSYMFGRDMEWLSASIAIGANFSWFSMNDDETRDAQILSALVAQLEFPRFTFPKAKMFSTFSLYTEFSLWFIPSDVTGVDVESVVPQISGGIRANIF